jgi:hypothetical protein
MKLTAQEAHDRIITAVGDDGTVNTQWGDETHGLWGQYASYDVYDAGGDLRYYATLRNAADLMLGQAAPAVSQSDGAGGTLTADQWFQHLKAIRDQAQKDYEARMTLVTRAGGLQVDVIAAYTLTPVFPGSRYPDPASPYFLGDPRYPTVNPSRGW